MKKIFAFLTAAAVFAGCNTLDREGAEPASRITIDPIITKATEVNFETGDKIGLTITKGGAAYAENACLTFDGTTFGSDLVWYTDLEEAAAFTAYYPYTEAGLPTTFSVQKDQSAGITGSDLMGAVKSDVYPSANAVAMVFKHLLTKLNITVKNLSGDEITSIVIKNSVTDATVDIAGLTASASQTGSTNDIVAYAAAADKYAAIVVPQTVAMKVEVNFKSGKTMGKNLAETTLKGGGAYTINVAISRDDIQVLASGEIENWTDEGDIEEGGVAFKEYEGYFEYDGERYNTVKLSNGQTWMAENLRYVPEGYTVSSDPAADAHIWYPYTSDGTTCTAATDAETIKAKGYLYDYYAAFGVEITEDNYDDFDGAQGICPKGWHIPTRADYIALCGTSLKGGEGVDAVTDETALWYDQTYKGGKITTAIASGWNFVFAGTRNKTTLTGAGSYMKNIITDKNCSVEAYYGNPSMTYYMSSTPYQVKKNTEGVVTNYQYFGMMSTFTSSYMEGRLNVGYTNVASGYAVRCIKDAE